MARSTHPDALSARVSERVVLWYRALPADDEREDEDDPATFVATRLSVSGADVLFQVGQTVVGCCDALELEDAIELALDILREARRRAPDAQVAFGLALGDVIESGQRASGRVFDRAQALAHRARSGELMCDEATHARLEATHLFARSVGAGELRGHVLDARFPVKRMCRSALALLRPAPLHPAAAETFEQLKAELSAPGLRRAVLSSAHPLHSAALIAQLEAERGERLMLKLARQGGGLQPLGGLQLALRRLPQSALAGLSPKTREVLQALADGAAVSRRGAREALRALLDAHPGSWLLLDRLREIDPPSLLVVADVLKDERLEAALLICVADEEPIPAALLRGREPARFALSPVDSASARAIAEAVLGAAAPDVPRRVAQLGGDSGLSIREAAATLVCAGDLVFDEGVFRFRSSPRSAPVAVPVDSLLTERIHGLSPAAHRTLDALCIAPLSASEALIARVAERDGLQPDEVLSGLATLKREGLIDEQCDLGPLSSVVRSAVRNEMPPARAAELHRFVADELRAELAALQGPTFACALLAGHLVEGGREGEAAVALLDAAQAATECGFERNAVRLAAFALKLDSTAEIRRRAQRIARTVESRPVAQASNARPPGEAEDESAREQPSDGNLTEAQIAQNAIRGAIAALVSGEPELIEGLLDTAVAAGWSRAGSQRLWALSWLSRGNAREAVRTFKQTRGEEENGDGRARDALTAALILLESGDPISAIQSALEALATCRNDREPRGERAALWVLSGCYRALGREADAERIEAATAAVARAGVPG